MWFLEISNGNRKILKFRKIENSKLEDIFRSFGVLGANQTMFRYIRDISISLLKFRESLDIFRRFEILVFEASKLCQIVRDIENLKFLLF